MATPIDLSTALSSISLLISGATAWLTLWRRGSLRMGRVQMVYLGLDGPGGLQRKVRVTAFLYSTSARGHIVEGMFARLQRGDSVQAFPVWIHQSASGDVVRGGGLCVTSNGIALDHIFLSPADGTRYRFLPGDYVIELFASVVGDRRPQRLQRVELSVSQEQAERIGSDAEFDILFDWSPEARTFAASIHEARKADKPEKPLLVELQGKPDYLRDRP